MAGGAASQFAVPRGQRYDDTSTLTPDLVLWRGLDPNQVWNDPNYRQPVPSNTVSPSALKTEELSTAVSDRANLATLRAPGATFANWKMAEFTVGEARQAGYIVMRDPTDPAHVLLYARKDPNNKPSKTEPKALARIARVV